MIIFSNLGARVYQSVFTETSGFSKGTFIGSVDIAGLTSAEAMAKVLDTVETWKVSSTFELKFYDQSVQMEPTFIQFDIKTSVDTAVDGQTSPLLATVREDILQEQIRSMDPSLSNSVQYESLKSEITNTVTHLKPGVFQFDLLTYIEQNSDDQVPKLLSKSTITNFDNQLQKYLADWIKDHNPINVNALESFSLLSVIPGEQLSNQRLEAMNIVANGLYEAALLAGFDIKERHMSRALPSYSTLGFDAVVKPAKFDLAFTNTIPSDVKLIFELIDSSFIVAIEGISTGEKYEVILSNHQTFKPKTVLQYTATLEYGQSRTLNEGRDGEQVEVYRNKLDQNGALLESNLISEDYYPPVHSIVQVPLTGEMLPGNIDDMQENTNIINDEQDLYEQPEPSLDNQQIPPFPKQGEQPEPSSPDQDDKKMWGSPDEIQKGS